MTTYSDGQHDNSTTIISDIRCAKNTKGFNGKDGNEKRNPCSENDLCSLKRNSEKEMVLIMRKEFLKAFSLRVQIG
jgi:hypothetical protein